MIEQTKNELSVNLLNVRESKAFGFRARIKVLEKVGVDLIRESGRS